MAAPDLPDTMARVSLAIEPQGPEDGAQIPLPLPGGAAAGEPQAVGRYLPQPGVFDECVDADAHLRPHWRELFENLSAFGPGEFGERTERARQLLHDNGVTYNVYGDPRNAARAIELDLVPLVISEAEWAEVEAGLIQRARLMNSLLADLYGEQRSLKDGVLHPGVVEGNPDYLRALRGFRAPGDIWLHVYAVDLVRGPDGRWLVVGDRTRTPAGPGYALENRIITSRSLAEAYRAIKVKRLAAWFDRLRQTLRALAPWTRYPRIVLLTPGPYNETYFEHAYLARYLGYTLVEGNDLTVRGDRVFLKTLGGLEPVDVILRRVDDDFCDPLELRGDSPFGVAGLVQAVLAGHVVVANALGSGLAETPAIIPYLPALSRHLLGEELALPNLDTVWAGEAQGRARLTATGGNYALRPAFPRIGVPAPGDGEAWGRHLDYRPYDAVGQAPVRLSTAPCFTPEGVRPRPVVLRAFLTATEKGFSVMPGGLVRIAPTTDRPILHLQQSGLSKDAWVLSSGPVEQFSLLRPPDTAVEVRRQGNNLPSRVADDLYWVGRYAERAEFGVRALRAVIQRLTDGGGPQGNVEIGPGVAFLASIGEITPELAELATTDREAFDAELLPMLIDEFRAGGFASAVRRLNMNTGMVRDRLSVDMTRVLLHLHGQIEEVGKATPGDYVGLLDCFDSIVASMAALSGLGMENMTRGQAWRFMDLGRRIERAVCAISLTRDLIIGGEDGENRALDLALEVADSFMTYRARYFTGAQFAPVLDLLLLDEANPRSLARQMWALADHVENLPRERGAFGSGAARLLAQTALAELRAAEIQRLAGAGADGRNSELEALLEAVSVTLPELSDIISQTYFSHALAVRPGGPIRTVSTP
ncbi:circularly permuted type 2 ATP-grasp protein [Zavarzinia compransoris]|uniref:circularly permuted type 2 ATP-grasp protein n=1 Tax=Zavarzinia marina TaxID=2911065 RepID=UPI001F17A5F1|nr:circularly permuted type 2 ATP-grasp protein [Zavarzinia marina]MCF4165958.1 circularly permuted type 2 ATP-grasp protein [Zavarzinia marina]